MKTFDTLLKQTGLLTILAISLASSLVYAAPTISSVSIQPETLAAGESFTVTVVASADATQGVVLLDFRPGIASLVRLPLIYNGTNWSATSTMPVFAGTAGQDNVSVKIEALIFDSVLHRDRRSELRSVSTQPLLLTLKITAPANHAIVGSTPVTVTGTVSFDIVSVTVRGLATTISNGVFSASVPLLEGENDIVVIGVTGAGAQVTDTVNVTLDTTAPTIAISGVVEGQVSTQNLTPIVTVTDANLQTVDATLNGNPFTLGTVISAEGDYLLAVNAVDLVGNQANRAVNFTIDRTPPIVTLAEPANAVRTKNLSIQVSGTVTDAHLSSLRVNGVVTSVGDNAFSRGVTLPVEGANVITVVATDTATLSATASRTVVRDTAAPAVVIASPATGAVVNASPVVVSGTADNTTAVLRINGVTTDIVAGAFTATLPLSPGANVIDITAADDLGNQTTRQLTVTLDSTAPTIQIAAPSDGFRTRAASITINGTVDDATALLTVNGAAVTTGPGGAFNRSITLSPGNNSVVAAAVDPAGNSAARTITVIQDTLAPVIQITAPTIQTRTKAPTVLVQGTVNDPSATIAVNGQAVVNSSGSFSTSLTLPSASGSVVISAVAADDVGNSSSAQVTVIRDITPPVIGILSPANNLVVHRLLVDVVGSVDDLAATVVVNGQSAVVANGRFDLLGLTLIEGTNTITVTATDDLGNESQPISISIIADTIAPPPPNAGTLPAYVKGDRLIVNGTTEANAVVTAEGGLTPVSVTATAAGQFQLTVLVTADAATTLSIRSTDRAGNRSDPLVHTVTSDTIPPVVTLSAPAAGSQSALSEVAVVGKVSDRNPIASVTVQGVPVSILGPYNTFSHILTLANGTHPIAVVATDAAGNVETRSISVNVTDDGLDQEAPVISVVSPPYDGSTSSATFDVTALILDQSAITDLARNGVPLIPPGDFLIGNRLNVSVTVDGNGEFTLSATDAGGRSRSITHRVRVDANVPTAPQVNLVTPGRRTNQEAVTIYGTAEAGTRLHVAGGLVDSETVVAANGSLVVNVQLRLNQDNALQLTVIDEVNNASPATAEIVTHDSLRPTVVGVVPVDGAIGVALNATVQVTFSEAMDVDTASAAVITANGASVAYAGVLVDGNRKVVATPAQPFADSATVVITIPTTVTDEAGNSLAVPFTSRFHVIDATTPAAPQVVPPPAYTNQSSIIIAGTAEPNSTISISGGASVASAPATPNGQFAVTVPLALNQTNTLSVGVVDGAGNSSSPVTVSVTHDNGAPTLTQVTPPDAATAIPLATAVVLQFSEPIAPASIATITVTAGALLQVSKSLPAPNQVTLTPNGSWPGQSLITVNIPASVTDRAGNGLANPQTTTFTTVDDVAPATPIVDSVTPTSPTNATSVVIAGFAEPLSTLRAEGGATVVTQTINTTGLYSLAVPLTLNATNTIRLRTTDTNNNPSPFTSPIVIVQDAIAPTVTTTRPADGETMSVTQSIFIQFSEAIAVAPLTADPPAIRVLDGQNVAVPGQLSLSETGRSVTFFPVQNLLPSLDYGIVVDTTIRDLAGNHLAQTVTVNFLTSELISIDRPPAPALIPLPPAVTAQAILPLTGTALPGATLHVLGGSAETVTTVNADGSFNLNLLLRENEANFLALYVVANNVIGAVRTVTVTHDSRIPGFRILTPQEGLNYHNRSVTVMGAIELPTRVSNIRVNGENAAQFGLFFARQIVYDDPGEKTITVAADIDGGASVFTDSVTFTYQPDAPGVDTQPPIVKIIYPEPLTTITRPIVEVMATVEEGAGVTRVVIDNIPFHNQIGNIFMIYAALAVQGENVITVEAVDTAGLLGFDSTVVTLDSIAPEPPQMDEQPALTADRLLLLTGTAEPNVGIRVEGGLTTVFAYAGADGSVAVTVPLQPNSANRLMVTAVDVAGNRSSTVEISVRHDDTRPGIVSTTPARDDIGVPPDQRIIITFSEPINETSMVAGSSITVFTADGSEIDGNAIFSADRTKLTFIPAFRFQRSDRITVTLASSISDLNGFTLGESYTFSFDTALFRTTLSGVVVDPNLQPLQNIRVSLRDPAISNQQSTIRNSVTSTFGTFLLDELPLGEQILVIDGRPDAATGESPTGDGRRFGLLEFSLNVVQDTDNSLGRPIFLVPVDLSTTTRIRGAGDTIAFTSQEHDLQGFSIHYQAGSARFGDGTTTGNLTATRIEPPYIPDRLPDGAIPHFMVEIGPDDLTFSPPASMTFPNVYDLEPGETVSVFHFKYGIHHFTELGEATVAADGTITTAPLLTDAGFVGIVPTDPEFDLTRIYLRGRVVDGQGNGLPGIFVNAIAGFTVAVTDANGEYSIPMPELRILLIRTFATVPTNLGAGGDSPSLIFQSALAEVNLSGVTEMPDIVVNVFFLGGSIRFVNEEGVKLPRVGMGYDNGVVTAIDDGTARAVNIFVYRRLGEADGQVAWDSIPYSRAVAGLAAFGPGYDASFSIPFIGSLGGESEDEQSVNTMIPKPGDLLKIVAFSPATGYYGETDLRIPEFGDGSSGSTDIDILTAIDLRPPRVTIDMNRVFFVDGIRRRENVPHSGLVLTSDEYVEIKTLWTTPATTPLQRSEIRLGGRLMIHSIGLQEDIFFTVQGGEQARIVEIREALFPQRLDVLQRDTEVGTETISLSPNGSFARESLIPLTIRTESYGLSVPDQPDVATIHQSPFFQVVKLNLIQRADGKVLIDGQFLPERSIFVGAHELTSGVDGSFSAVVDSLAEGGVQARIDDGAATLVGASYTPVIVELNPTQGSQGDKVVITGEFFSPIATQNKVRFNGAPARVVAASETRLEVEVPEDASAGDVTVTLAGRTSNGVYFDFISEGLVNGSFESASLRGFRPEGTAIVTKQIRAIVPTDRTYMAYLNTDNNPRTGRSSLLTDRFFVPSGLPYLVFDYNFLGTLILRPVREYIEIAVLDGANEVILDDEIGLDSPTFSYSMIGGYGQGTGFRSVVVDLSTYAGLNQPIQFRVTLKGRGRAPSQIPGMRPDDDNPLDITKLPGTALLLDNFRMAANDQLPIAPAVENVTTSVAGNGAATIDGQVGSVGAASRVYAWSLQSGKRFVIDAAADGSFTLPVPVVAGILRTSYALSYSTPKTTTDDSSDRLFSPTVVIGISDL